MTIPARKSPEESVELRRDYDISIDEEVKRINEHPAALIRARQSALTGSVITPVYATLRNPATILRQD